MSNSQDKIITLCAVGDMALTDGVENQINKHGIESPFLKIKNFLKDGDIKFANLENVFCDNIKGIKNQAHLLRGKPENIFSITNADFNIVSLANNHILDYGEDGLKKTISLLDTHKILHTGAGTTLSMARQPVILDKKGIAFGFLAYAMKGIQSSSTNTAGAAWIDYEQIKEDMLNLKAKVDHIIISLHAGIEFIDYPHPDHRKLCHKITDLGASLIIGHHPHVIQGIEKVNNCLIAYSLGNLIFDTMLMDYKTPYSQQSIMLKCKFNKKSIVNYEIIPTIINDNYQPEIADDNTREIILYRLNKISQLLTTNNYPGAYFKQASELWPKINIAVNLKIIKEQGLLAFIRRLPRVKKIYIALLFQYIYKKFKSLILFPFRQFLP
jgi:poly-gamma-glutamate synthesis protein (capsule biosynthesis protein)